MINFTDSVNIYEADSFDEYGIAIDGNVSKDVPCKIMYSLRQDDLEVIDGKSVRVKARVYFEGLYKLNYSDKIQFTDSFGYTHTQEILDMKPIIDFSDEIVYTRATL